MRDWWALPTRAQSPVDNLTDVTEEGSTDERGLFGRVIDGASDRVLDIVDPNLVLDHVDVNALLDRIEVDDLLDRVDIDRLLDRVDVDALLQRADIDALMERVDIEVLVERAGIPEIVAESTSHLGGSALDLFRRPLVGLDEIIFRVLNGLLRRDPGSFPQGPKDLVEWVDERKKDDVTVKTGRYAGPLTRLLAVIADGFIVGVLYTVIAAGAVFVIEFVAPDVELGANRGVWYGVGFLMWAFVYLWLGLAIFGKTIGKWVIGLRVVGSDGSPVVSGRSAFVRTLTYPLSFIVLGLGLLGIVFGRERRAWHDHIAGTAVVYDWGSRTAAMPTPLADFLERRGESDSIS